MYLQSQESSQDCKAAVRAYVEEVSFCFGEFRFRYSLTVYSRFVASTSHTVNMDAETLPIHNTLLFPDSNISSADSNSRDDIYDKGG